MTIDGSSPSASTPANNPYAPPANEDAPPPVGKATDYDRDYLRAIVRGVLLVLLGGILRLAISATSSLVGARLGPWNTVPLIVVTQVALTVAYVVIAAGWWLLTRRGQGRGLHEDLLRGLVVAVPFIGGVQAALAASPYLHPAPFIELPMSLISRLVDVAYPIAALLYLGKIDKQLGHARAPLIAKIAIGLSLCVAASSYVAWSFLSRSSISEMSYAFILGGVMRLVVGGLMLFLLLRIWAVARRRLRQQS